MTDTDEALDALPIAQVEAELARARMQHRIPNQSPHLLKSLEKRLIWLTRYLERRKGGDADGSRT